MAESLRFFRRIMLLLNAAVCAFLAWVFGMTPVLAARQADGLSFAQNLSALPAKPWTLAVALFGMAALILAGVLRRRGYDRLGWTEPLFAICVIFALHLAYNGLLLYFEAHTRQLLQSTVDLLGALHLILFVVYMVVLIGQRTEENSAIRRLNGELEQANDRLSVLNEQLKAYAAESERMAETRERNRLAREIHDTLGHALTGITAGADAVYRIVQESITNAIRHGHATAVRVCITVTDNGCGCTKIEPGFGLRHMRERLKLLNGTLKVKSENGFELHAEIPLRWGDVYD